MDEKGILTVVSGFSGAGKGTVIKELISMHEDYALSISMTTRAPREGEIEGKHYFFTTRDEFEKNIASDGLIEFAEYCGNYYGTPRSYVEECLNAGKNVILEIEMQGALKIRSKFKDAVLIFIIPPDAESLKDRLEGRGTEEKDVIKKRLVRAVEEADGVGHYDYVVVNDTPAACAARVHSIIEASKSRASNYRGTVGKIQEDLKAILKGDLQ